LIESIHCFVKAKTGYSQLTGVDYSSSAVELAKAFTADEGLNITFEVSSV
jgi:2-polyprenyl-3-methyl-5-hydroxy-6-metoxy-1,4-benzoquinol methylase